MTLSRTSMDQTLLSQLYYFIFSYIPIILYANFNINSNLPYYSLMFWWSVFIIGLNNDGLVDYLKIIYSMNYDWTDIFKLTVSNLITLIIGWRFTPKNHKLKNFLVILLFCIMVYTINHFDKFINYFSSS
ncbi:hypothetical protein DAPK24_038840 [Pichia kluyveri]|uniref:Uncharacterized protein n=1 Tax=Pichia kluyveri TaxID=36015 RepID=A0AAV5R752_PICKL|nr:hypothetical protein DAPK24_038840 [Pichia kluyveri]